MIRYLGCEIARDMLDGFVDGELAIPDQVALESHLRWCDTCSARLDDLRIIGASMRHGSRCLATHANGSSDVGSLVLSVVTYIKAERQDSLAVRIRGLFDDMRLLWPAIGATMAAFACLVGAAGVLRAASDEKPESMAGLIQFLANPGSDCNPLPLGHTVSVPRALDDGPALDSIPDEEAVFALSTVVTREGRIANYELLEPVSTSLPETAAKPAEVTAVLNAVQRSRFEPAQSATGDAVAVNMIWVLARTTVKGASERPLDFELPWPELKRAREVGPSPAEATNPTLQDRQTKPRRSTTA
jgi:hypothetical protein